MDQRYLLNKKIDVDVKNLKDAGYDQYLNKQYLEPTAKIVSTGVFYDSPAKSGFLTSDGSISIGSRINVNGADQGQLEMGDQSSIVFGNGTYIEMPASYVVESSIPNANTQGGELKWNLSNPQDTENNYMRIYAATQNIPGGYNFYLMMNPGLSGLTGTKRTILNMGGTTAGGSEPPWSHVYIETQGSQYNTDGFRVYGNSASSSFYQRETDGAVPAVVISQADVDQPFIEFLLGTEYSGKSGTDEYLMVKSPSGNTRYLRLFS